jgi:hypothetical protein
LQHQPQQDTGKDADDTFPQLTNRERDNPLQFEQSEYEATALTELADLLVFQCVDKQFERSFRATMLFDRVKAFETLIPIHNIGQVNEA